MYWRKLLEVCQIERLAVRCRMVVPENCTRLPGHMSLTSKLLASPRALTRIQLFCRGRLGYIVPGVLGPEEVLTPSSGHSAQHQLPGKLGLWLAKNPAESKAAD